MEWATYMLGGLSTTLTIAVGLLTKLLFNHLHHLREDIQELRALFIEPLKEHQHK